MSLFLILLAAGDSKRLKSHIPKPYHVINNKPIIVHSINAFKDFYEIRKTVVVYNRRHKKYLDKLKLKNFIKVVGGKNRQESTFRALKKIKNMGCTKVLIHDSARPTPPKIVIKKIIQKLKKNYIVVPLIKVNDATKRIKKNIIFKNISRDNLRFAQTPQGFDFKKIYKKHKENTNLKVDDDSALFTNGGDKILAVNGSKKNLKITDKDDLENFSLLKNKKTNYGIGFDIHRLVKKRKLFLGGIKIPFAFGLKGHSDADPVLHAIIDALLGACQLGDIGKIFSDKKKEFKDIRSTEMLKKVIKMIKNKNFSVNNIDINIITQKPKIKKYKKKMTAVISKICEINIDQINIKGRTTEKLGLIGKEQAIASEVIASVIHHD